MATGEEGVTLARIAVYFDERMVEHDTGAGFFELAPSPLLEVTERHPENADRLRNMRSVCTRGPIASQLDWHTPHEATLDELATVHDRAYVEQVKADSVQGKRYGASTLLPPGGWTAVTLAAGAALDAADRVLSGESSLAYCLVRPPGHHASRANCDGYCFVNNAALCAQRAVAQGHRVAVIDFDVHHGNGTQSIFYGRSDVLCVSMHMDQGPWDEGTSHPETGAVDEVGSGDGIGFTLNVPLDLGSGDSVYRAAFDAIVVPEVAAFKPTFIVVACGVDGSQIDPNGASPCASRQLLTMRGFYALGKACRLLADTHADGRLVCVQEGGYSMSYAAYCVHAVLEGIAGFPAPLLADPLLGTYPDPPRRDPANWRIASLIARMKADRADAIAAARAAFTRAAA